MIRAVFYNCNKMIGEQQHVFNLSLDQAHEHFSLNGLVDLEYILLVEIVALVGVEPLS